MNRFIAHLWHLLRGSLQWRVLWLVHAKFMIGVTGIVRDESGQILLLRHRIREVREETGLTVTIGDLARLRSGYRLRIEVAYEATCTGGELRLGSLEILEARWFHADALPAGILDAHLALIHNTPAT